MISRAIALAGLVTFAGVGAAEAKVASNAITLNAITLNAIALNAITLNAITLNAITLNAITLNGADASATRPELQAPANASTSRRSGGASVKAVVLPTGERIVIR